MSTEFAMIFGDEGVDELLDDNGADQRDGSGHGAGEDGHDGRERAADPGTDDGDDVHDAGDEAEHGGVGHADEAEQHAAAHADDGALEQRPLDVAAHDAVKVAWKNSASPRAWDR